MKGYFFLRCFYHLYFKIGTSTSTYRLHFLLYHWYSWRRRRIRRIFQFYVYVITEAAGWEKRKKEKYI